MGRAPGADFVVDAALVSRVHCRFTLNRGQELELEDLGSTNGTFVNGKKVGKAMLRDGDKVAVGRVPSPWPRNQAPPAAEHEPGRRNNTNASCIRPLYEGSSSSTNVYGAARYSRRTGWSLSGRWSFRDRGRITIASSGI